MIYVVNSLLFHVPTTADILGQGQQKIWTEHSHTALFFENLKPLEISKHHLNVIWTSLKVVKKIQD